MTYSDLVARLNAALGDDHSTDSDWASFLPSIIEQGELRCYRDVDFLATRKTATVTLAQDAATFAAPADWLLGQDIRLTSSNTTLDRRDPSFVSAYGGTGTPRYWAEPTQGTIALAPVPSSSFGAELTYHCRPAALTQLNPMTWLATNAPDLFFLACMVVATGYLRNYGAQADDPKMALSWEQAYRTALEGVRREEGRRKGDNAFDSSFAPPPSSNLPAGVQ